MILPYQDAGSQAPQFVVAMCASSSRSYRLRRVDECATPRRGPPRGLLQLAQAAEDIGDQAQAMVWLIEQDEDVHPILGLALGDSDEVVVQVPVGADSEADGRTLAELQLNIEPGFTVLAIRRGGGYRYRPGGRVRLLAGDEVIASGPDEGREFLTRRFGWVLVDPDGDGEMELEPVAPRG